MYPKGSTAGKEAESIFIDYQLQCIQEFNMRVFPLRYVSVMAIYSYSIMLGTSPAKQSRRTPTKYRFNAEKYAELKQKGFRLEF